MASEQERGAVARELLAVSGIGELCDFEDTEDLMSLVDAAIAMRDAAVAKALSDAAERVAGLNRTVYGDVHMHAPNCSNDKPCDCGARAANEVVAAKFQTIDAAVRAIKEGSSNCCASTLERNRELDWNTRPLEDAKDAEIARLRELVRDAAIELHRAGADGIGVSDAWRDSAARKALGGGK